MADRVSACGVCKLVFYDHVIIVFVLCQLSSVYDLLYP